MNILRRPITFTWSLIFILLLVGVIPLKSHNHPFPSLDNAQTSLISLTNQPVLDGLFFMKEVSQKVRLTFTNPTHSRTLTILIMLIIVAAIPLTVYISQKPQELRQRASGTLDPIGWWKLDGGTNDFTNNNQVSGFDYWGITQPPIGNFNNPSDAEGFALDCNTDGGARQKRYEAYPLDPTNPSVTDTAIKIWATGGDGLVCIYKSMGNIPIGTTIYFKAKGYVEAKVWDGAGSGATRSYTEEVATGCSNKESRNDPNAHIWRVCHGSPYTDWTEFKLVVDQSGSTNEFVYFYNDPNALGETNASYYDDIHYGPGIGLFDNGSDSTFDGFAADCGGQTQRLHTQGYEGSAMKVWSGGGDGLACAFKYIPKLPIGGTIYLWAKGYVGPRLYGPNNNETGYVEDVATGCNTQSQAEHSAERTNIWKACNNNQPYTEWKLFKLVSLKNETNQVILYNNWNNSGTTGTHATDGSDAASYDLVMYGPLVENGKIGKAFSFNGSDRILIPNSSILSGITQSLTISAWVNPSATQFSNAPTVISKHTGVTPGAQYQLGLYSTGGTNKIRFCAEPTIVTNGTNSSCPIGNTSVPNNAWSLITVTADGSRVKFYVNGTQDVDLPMTGQFTPNSAPLAIGAASYTDPAWGYNGLVDDVRIYNRALSASEVQLLSLLEPTLTPTPSPTGIPPTATSTNTPAATLTPSPGPFVANPDVNRDGCVGRADYNAWRTTYLNPNVIPSYNGHPTHPDINGDNAVDLIDYNYWYNAMLSGTNVCSGG